MKVRKKTATLLIAIFMMSTLAVIPVLAKPSSFKASYFSTQFQWRAMKNSFGTWTVIHRSPTSDNYKLTGNALHTKITYSPSVIGERGTSAVYVYDKNSDHWILNEGKTSYIYSNLYAHYRVTNYFRGYMEFTATPTPNTFKKGVLCQWIYVMKPQNEPVQSFIPNAVWDPVMNAWLVGFSLYLYDNQQPIPQHPTPPLGPLPIFPRPIPANNYNPLGL